MTPDPNKFAEWKTYVTAQGFILPDDEDRLMRMFALSECWAERSRWIPAEVKPPKDGEYILKLRDGRLCLRDVYKKNWIGTVGLDWVAYQPSPE